MTESEFLRLFAPWVMSLPGGRVCLQDDTVEAPVGLSWQYERRELLPSKENGYGSRVISADYYPLDRYRMPSGTKALVNRFLEMLRSQPLLLITAAATSYGGTDKGFAGPVPEVYVSLTPHGVKMVNDYRTLQATINDKERELREKSKAAASKRSQDRWQTLAEELGISAPDSSFPKDVVERLLQQLSVRNADGSCSFTPDPEAADVIYEVVS